MNKWLDDFEKQLREDMNRMLFEPQRPWSITLMTLDGCSRTLQMQELPEEIKVPIWPKGARKPSGERVYARESADQGQRMAVYREKEKEKPKERYRSYRDVERSIRDMIFTPSIWDRPRSPFEPRKKDMLLTKPSTEDVKKYTLSGGGRTEILTDDLGGWGRIEIKPGMLLPVRVA